MRQINEFTLGVQYFGPPHTKEVDWIRDFKLIKEHGLVVVKIWAIWGYLEPMPNKYDFTEFDRLFEVAENRGLHVIVNTVIEIQPFWIHRLFPQAYMVDQFGESIESTTGEYSCGISPGVCLDHLGPRAQAEKFLVNLASHFKDRENLLCWDAWNEVRWQDNVTDRVHNPAYIRILCYCEKTIEKFRRWLEKKYGSLDRLNEKWRRKYVDWADVFPPRGGWWSYAYPEMVDWRNFMIDNIVDKLELRVNALRRGDPEHPIMMHTGTSSIRSIGAICIGASDDWKLSKVVDFYGTSFYPVWAGAKPEENCLCLDGIRSASGDKPFWISELQGGPSFHSPGKGNNYYPQDLKLWTYTALSYGAKGILYWSWRPEPFGPETLGFGLTLFDGTPTERTKMVKEISQVIKENDALFLNAKVYPSQVAILFDPDLYIIDFYGGTGGMERGMVVNSTHGWYKAFWENNIWCDFIHADEMGNLENYKLLVLPFAICLKQKVVQRIKDYIKSGGLVLTEAYLGRFEETLTPATSFPAYSLQEVFKVKGEEVEFVDSIKILPKRDEEIFKGVEYLTGYYFKEMLQPLPGSEILGKFEDGAPAIIKGRYGKGETILFGSLMALNYPKIDDGFKKMISNVCNLVGVSPPIKVSSSEGGIVRTRILTHSKGYLIFCINYGDKCKAKIELYIPKPKFIQEITRGSNIEYSSIENFTELNVMLDRKDVKIFLYAFE
jgi:beta-galactosidase